MKDPGKKQIRTGCGCDWQGSPRSNVAAAADIAAGEGTADVAAACMLHEIASDLAATVESVAGASIIGLEDGILRAAAAVATRGPSFSCR